MRSRMRLGDFLVSYDGRPLETIDDLRAAIAAAQTAGKTAIPLVIYRGAKRLEVSVGPGRVGVGLATR